MLSLLRFWVVRFGLIVISPKLAMGVVILLMLLSQLLLLLLLKLHSSHGLIAPLFARLVVQVEGDIAIVVRFVYLETDLAIDWLVSLRPPDSLQMAADPDVLLIVNIVVV